MKSDTESGEEDSKIKNDRNKDCEKRGDERRAKEKKDEATSLKIEPKSPGGETEENKRGRSTQDGRRDKGKESNKTGSIGRLRDSAVRRRIDNAMKEEGNKDQKWRI